MSNSPNTKINQTKKKKTKIRVIIYIWVQVTPNVTSQELHIFLLQITIRSNGQ